MNIVWGSLGTSLVFRVDRTNDRLILNNRYKKEIIKGGIGAGDASSFKMLLLLILRGHFGSRESARLKAMENEYQELLLSLLGGK